MKIRKASKQKRKFRFDLLKYADFPLFNAENFCLTMQKKLFLSFHSHRTRAEPKSAVENFSIQLLNFV